MSVPFLCHTCRPCTIPPGIADTLFADWRYFHPYHHFVLLAKEMLCFHMAAVLWERSSSLTTSYQGSSLMQLTGWSSMLAMGFWSILPRRSKSILQKTRQLDAIRDFPSLDHFLGPWSQVRIIVPSIESAKQPCTFFDCRPKNHKVMKRVSVPCSRSSVRRSQ